MKTLVIIAACFTSYVCNAQLVEHFNDGNFTNDPVWSGSAPHFIINGAQQLQLNNTAAGSSYLSTAFAATSINGYEWEVYVKQSFAGSASNFGRVYLVSNQSNLTGPLNGYYLQLGEAGSNDAVELFRQAGTVHTSVCRAANAAIANSFAIRIKVKRAADATWTIFVDYAGGSSFVEAAHGTDAMFTSTAFLGVYCLYTIGNANRFFFDDFIAGPPLGDITPPVFQSIIAESSATLRLKFSEPIDSISSCRNDNFMVSGGIGAPSLCRLLDDLKTAKLTFLRPFLNGRLYTITIDSVRDMAGNLMLPVTTTFRHFVPSQAARGDIVFNELFPDPSPTMGLPAQEFIELFNRSDKAFDLAGWKISDLTSSATLPSQFLLPGEFLIVTSSAGLAGYSGYGMTLGLADMPTLNNSSDEFLLKDGSGIVIDSVHYSLAWYRDDDRAQGGYTLERLHPEVDSNEPLNWISSEASVGGTPGSVNSVFGRKLDTQSPVVDSVVVLSSHELRIYFSEAIDSISAAHLNNYLIETSGYRPIGLTVATRYTSLYFDTAFVNGAQNHLLIDSVLDTSGNMMEPCRIGFRYFAPIAPAHGVILINEIMADPTPVVQLPEAEYIEIVNRSRSPYDLSNWILSDATGTARLPSAIIMPGEFIVLTSTSNASRFASFARVIAITGFPSLSNSGEPLVLKGPAGETIDSVRFDVAWYRDDNKRDGGWSLERLRYEFNSTWDLNWRASVDSAGGTPGKTNSCFGQHPDQESPFIVSTIPVSDHVVSIGFSEPVIFRADVNRIGLDSLRCTGIQMLSPSIAQLTFDRLFENGMNYSLLVDGIRDTAMNAMSPAVVVFTYFVPQPVFPDDIVISEIMADPSPVVGLPEAEYIEIFNRSSNPVNLAGWQLRDAQSTVVFPARILRPDERIVATTSSAAAKFPAVVQILGVAGFPSLSNDGEQLMLIDQNGILIDSVNYSIEWYRSSEKRDGGWSLELIDPENLCGEGDNWTDSESEAGGTPGSINSVNANKPDVWGPRLMSAVASRDSVVLEFNEKLSTSLAGISVSLFPAAGECTIRFRDARLRTLVVNCGDEIQLSTEYKLTIENLRDCAGNLINEAFSSIAFALPEDPEAGDVVINEILFNPRPGGVDFVEVYNQGPRYVDLRNWKLARNDGEHLADWRDIKSAAVLKPFSYLVFTTDMGILKSQYPQCVDALFAGNELPPMPDEEGSIVLLSVNGISIDSVVYDDNMHADLLRDTEGVSLERISASASSTDRSNWRSANEDAGYATPGLVNSNFRMYPADSPDEVTIFPEIISHQRNDSFALISYKLSEPGYYVNCSIVDLQGRMVYGIAENMSVGADGFFRWDATNDSGNPVSPGYYVVNFEYFNIEGEVKAVRKRVVVAPR